MTSLSASLRETGDDRDDVLTELAEDLKRAKALGLTLDIDASLVSSQGMAQVFPTEPEPPTKKAAS